MCKFLSQAVEQNDIFLIALVKCSPSPPRKGVAIWVFSTIHVLQAFGPSPISQDGRWCRLGASDKEGGSSSSSWIPASLNSRLFCRTASHTRSTQLSQRVTNSTLLFSCILNTFVTFFNNIASRIQILKWAPHIIWSCKDFFCLLVMRVRREGHCKGARDNCDRQRHHYHHFYQHWPKWLC